MDPALGRRENNAAGGGTGQHGASPVMGLHPTGLGARETSKKCYIGGREKKTHGVSALEGPRGASCPQEDFFHEGG